MVVVFYMMVTVSRRTGGLENAGAYMVSDRSVSRRTGGLEITGGFFCAKINVSRRTGGLEMPTCPEYQ